MTKKYLLSVLIATFAITMLCLLAGCNLLGGIFGGGDELKDNQPIDSDAVRYLHFVDENSRTIRDYEVNKRYEESVLKKVLEELEVNYCTVQNGKYLDGTNFSTDKDELSNYFVNHYADTQVHGYPAYTVVLELVPIKHSLDLYVDGELYMHYELTYAEWIAFDAPAVPKRDGYAGKWSPLPMADNFGDLRSNAEYVVTKPIRSPQDWDMMTNSKSYFVLENDIDFNGEAIPTISGFGGTFDGQGYKVTNFNNSHNYCSQIYGLFLVNKGTICNVTFSNGTFVAHTQDTISNVEVGFVTGENNGVITNVVVENIEIDIWCRHSTKNLTNVPTSTNGRLAAGIIAGENYGEISYVTVADTVTANFTTVITAKRNDAEKNTSMEVGAYYGAIAGVNGMQISHATVLATITSPATLSQNTINEGDRHFRYITFNLSVGGVVGLNGGASKVLDCYANCAVSSSNDIMADVEATTFTSTVNVGGVVGSGTGSINRCVVGSDTMLSAYCNAECHVGGIIGENSGSATACYSYAQFTLDNRHPEAKTYAGGLVGYNKKGLVSFSYAVVNVLRQTTDENARQVYFGGMYGYADDGVIEDNFVSLNTAGTVNSNVAGFYKSGNLDYSNYVYLTSAATDYQPSDKVTVCDTVQQMVSSLFRSAFEYLGFVFTDGAYPTLSNVGNTK